MLNNEALTISSLGPCQVKSPLRLNSVVNDGIGNYVPDDMRVRYQVETRLGQIEQADRLYEKAGPRENIFFKPETTRAAIVTCGGLCPGLNNVIRSAFLELYHNYGVGEVFGIRYGYHGLNPAVGTPPILLTPDFVDDIHEEGGTVLGSSRGPEEPSTMADFLEREHINLLLCVGGDGTQRGCHALAEEVRRRNLPIAVIGIPKTIDNDIACVSRTFGFSTAIEKAREVLSCAHIEARGAFNGIGLVKLMGRDAGFIAAGATLASQEVNFTLIPEVPFVLEGENGFLQALRERIERRHHAVIAIAEGAGQNLLTQCPEERDASGNIKQGDIGIFLKDAISKYFNETNISVQLKYFDPSYLIRSVRANCDDGLLCDLLARHAVHAGMAGKTDTLIGLWNDTFIHVPIGVAIGQKKKILPESDLWRNVLATTGQRCVFK